MYGTLQSTEVASRHVEEQVFICMQKAPNSEFVCIFLERGCKLFLRRTEQEQRGRAGNSHAVDLGSPQSWFLFSFFVFFFPLCPGINCNLGKQYYSYGALLKELISSFEVLKQRSNMFVFFLFFLVVIVAFLKLLLRCCTELFCCVMINC